MDQTSDSHEEPKHGFFARLFRKNEPAEVEAQAEAAGLDDELTCTNPNCIIHGQGGALRVPFPPVLGALIAMQHPAAQTGPAPAVRAWSPMFADKISTGDLVGVPAGMFGRSERELKVCEIREHPGSSEDPLAPYRTLLLVDTTNGEVFSPTVSAHQGFRVAPSVPDSPAFLGGGA